MRTSLRLTAVAAILSGLAPALVGQPAAPGDLRAADLAWERGDYIAALNGYLALLNGPSAADVLEPIALTTGELYRTEAITTDGLSPRFSRDARLIAYEAGTGAEARTRIVAAATGHAPVAELPGYGATFSPAGDRVAYLKLRPAAELTSAQTAVKDASPQARRMAQQQLAWLMLKHSTIVERDLATGREAERPTGGLLKTTLAYSADGSTVYFIGADEQEDGRSEIYAVGAGARAPVKITGAPGMKSAMLIDPTGTVLVYDTTPRNPFRAPGPPEAGGRPGEPGGPSDQPISFGIVHLATGQTRIIEGRAPALSADGSTVAYVAREGTENTVVVSKVFGTPVVAKQTTERVAAPALSPDGSRVAFQVMPWFDWEIVVINSDGTGETRVTREIQHDVQPQFLSNDRLIAAIGEARHRRSYLYDLDTLARTRLFHNNTVRTIAPEYQWVASLAGDALLVSAERDGDTVSEERGVYLVRLDRTVTREDLVARIEAGLAAETALRARGRRMFEPIAGDVRAVVAEASVARVFGYEKALFDFDSKHISKPGNRRAAEYLFGQYASFGYTPEYQWFDHRGALDGKTANVLATLRGTENPELVYVVSSHYDSTSAGPGADDDTSGTAALLEAARILAGRPQPATIVFASFTGEEAGLLGSREFVRQAVERKTKVVGALNNDMIGWANDQRLDNTIRYSNPGIRDVQHAAALLFTNLITYDALYYKSTDAAAYYEAYGDIVGGIGSYPVLGNPHYHQSHDLLETMNHDLITEVAKTTAATLMLLASSPSRLQDLTVASQANGSAELTWTPSPEQGVREYIVAAGEPGGQLVERMRVTSPAATLGGLEPGTVVAVKAVNARGLEGWDWAMLAIR